MIFMMKVLLIVFFYSVQCSFTPGALEMKFQGYFELKNYQQTEITEIGVVDKCVCWKIF